MHHAMNRVSATKTMPVITKVMFSVVSIVPQLDARGVNHHGLTRLNTTETPTSTARTSATITACSPCSCSLRMLLRRTGLPDCYPLPEDVSKYTIQCSEISEPGQGLVKDLPGAEGYLSKRLVYCTTAKTASTASIPRISGAPSPGRPERGCRHGRGRYGGRRWRSRRAG